MASRLSLLLCFVATVCAQYDSFYFASSQTDYQCDGLDFTCAPPFVCSHDSTVNKYYCCIPGSTSNVCWIGSTECSGGNSTTAGSNQIDCGGYCCLSGREECTQRSGQINICWATQTNPVENITDAQMNDTFSSLSSANPSATSYPVQLAQLVSTSVSSTASITISSGPTSDSTTASLPTQTDNSQVNGPSYATSGSQLSSGALAGIVLGGIVGIIGISWCICCFLKRRSPSHKHERNADGSRQGPAADYSGLQMSDGSQFEYYAPKAAPKSTPVEVPASSSFRSELNSDTMSQAPQELPADRVNERFRR